MGLNKKYQLICANFFISLSIIALFLIFAYFIWFPAPFAEISGFNKTAVILLLTNICLGPLLIFIIYKDNKKNLKLDLSILAVIQVSAFIFGAYSFYLKHPVYAVFAVDRFTLINANSTTVDKIRYPELVNSLFSSPKFVFAKRPEAPEKRNQLLFSVLFEGKPDLDRRPEYYEPFNQHLSSVFKRSINTDILFHDATSRKKLTDFLNKNGGIAKDYAFFPLQRNRGDDLIWVLNRKTGLAIDTIDSDPWQMAKN